MSTNSSDEETPTEGRQLQGQGRVQLAFLFLIVLGSAVVDKTRGPILSGLRTPSLSPALIAWGAACFLGWVLLLLPTGRWLMTGKRALVCKLVLILLCVWYWVLLR